MKQVSECNDCDFNVDGWCNSLSGCLMSGREKVYNAVVAYIQEHQYPPSVRELCDMTGLKSTSSIHAHITRLINDGRLETDSESGTPRALRVPGYQFVKIEIDATKLEEGLKM